MNDYQTNEKILLLVIKTLGKIPGRTYLQKLFFLIERELFPKLDLNLNYIKYHYGPFSKNLQVMVDSLKKKHMISEVNISSGEHATHFYLLTTDGKDKVEIIAEKEPKITKEIKSFCDRFQNHSPSELLRFVYARYPDWTVNSVLNQEF
ncbi:hypothetical protein ACFL1H_02160 [Nanoarchaeota archaeon]